MRVQAEVVIHASPAEVFAYVTQPEKGPEWQEGAVWTARRDPGPIRLGSWMDHEGRWLGLKVRSSGFVDAWEPDRLYGYTGKTAFGRMTMRYELDRVPEGTRVTLSNEAPLPLLMRPLIGVFRRNVQGMFDRDVVRLRDRVEAAGHR
ncbi:MAG: SRPBCC family protein [Chloroflexi bacterium]|nr:SRPBCC family protein [Chloroflexota bacterium]